ncbi:probable LSG1-Large-Subunit GTPase involved in 60S ribosomal subunit biogenesis [Ustilago bromivora]|uniref:Probable LSG1 - Large-Subunit GTPase involved in 60S ribosomal subunit biogenesis n=1 Tax=Ustilago bromivora TaxID=307758 RepID=A0A1K0FUS9_9BASI|nr:probable LSG1-Large-Subunit GTPase involved in 60S ribosomal subunit biogenesis [Ustilago bromivora]SYW77765.1 probable LSG1 - Large-Subunit GTPase involved in 60S ribosomal subunit biogenesis [Ustilago bromivora]
MPLAQSKNTVGLGRAILNRKAKEAKQRNQTEFHTTDINNYGSVSNLRSVTHEGDLEEFLNTASLADADFTAERRSGVTVITAPNRERTRHNPYLLTGQEEQEVLKKHAQNKERLRVPRRPEWDSTTTRAQLERAEKDGFLEWRRGLAELQEGVGLVLTPFERNLEVWRQLWRVIERSHLVVQIVDARNPLRFRCEDLEKYVASLGIGSTNGMEYLGEESEQKGPRRNLLLINKADLLDDQQRRYWADYFDAQGIQYAFFSAANAAAIQLARAEEEEPLRLEQLKLSEPRNEDDEEEDDENEEHARAAASAAVSEGAKDAKPLVGQEATDRVNDHSHATVRDNLVAEKKYGQDDAVDAATATAATTLSATRDPTRVLNVLELEELFMACAPPLDDFAIDGQSAPSKLVVGLVGYPNVGKSSTINALLGEKKVSVSSTPGKTKHFQTIHLSPTTVLCDCPGLVFPQFATTSAELVCDGVLPIDQMREYTAPAELVAKRIPKDIVEGTYGIRIETLTEEEGGNGIPTGLEMLTAYAVARGFTRQGQGNPDESRAVRYVLKDYVNAKLLYGHPPPGIDPDLYNSAQRERARAALAGRKYDPSTAHHLAEHDADDLDDLDTDIQAELAEQTRHKASGVPRQSAKSKAIDSAFFDTMASSKPTIVGRTGLPQAAIQGRVANDGTVIKKSAASAAGEGKAGSKKHNKANKRKKQRSGAGFD